MFQKGVKCKIRLPLLLFFPLPVLSPQRQLCYQFLAYGNPGKVYQLLLLLLLLNRFSHVQLCATPQMAAHQAPPSLGFSRQEHWSGLPFPSPVCESESDVAESCLTPSDPMDCSPPAFSIHGIFQARVLEWGAIDTCFIFEWIWEWQKYSNSMIR